MTTTADSLDHITESLRPLAVPIASLTLDPANARRHPEKNLGAVEASLRLYRGVRSGPAASRAAR